MAGNIRKCVVFGPINDGGAPEQGIFNPEDVRFVDGSGQSNLTKLQILNTRWARLWMRWDKAQLFPPPRPGQQPGPGQVPMNQLDTPANGAPGYGTGGGYRYIQALDAQVDMLRSAGIGVVLTSWMFPRWANGTAGQPADWEREDRGAEGAPITALKQMEFRVPVNETGVDGYWGQWVDFLVNRYKKHGCGVILELMNEPNLQMWPQQAKGNTQYAQGAMSIHLKIAEMMHTGLAISSRHNYPILLAAPGLSDHLGASSRLRSNYLEVANNTLSHLQYLNFPHHPTFIWSHHNYTDVEQGTSRTLEMRSALVGRWRGYSSVDATSGQHPSVWLTEGGARLGSNIDQNQQSARVALNWSRMTDATGIDMFGNYLMYGAGNTQSGLREEVNPSTRLGPPRLVWDTFRGFPGRA